LSSYFLRAVLGVFSLFSLLLPATCEAECTSGVNLSRDGLCLSGSKFNLQASPDGEGLFLEKGGQLITANVSCGQYWGGDKRKDRLRSEYQSIDKAPVGREVFRSFSFKVDERSDREALKKGVVVAQFHATEDLGDFSGYPVFEVVLKDDGIEVYSSSNPESVVSTPYPRVLRGGPFKVNYYDFVSVKISLVFSYSNMGSILFSLNGIPVVDLKRVSVGHNDSVGPYFKFGVYTPEYECHSGFKVYFRDIVLN
jgi:hypothetical protein